MGDLEDVKQDAELEDALAIIESSTQALSVGVSGRNKHQESALVYIASLPSEESQKTARNSLRKIARILGLDPQETDSDCWLRVPWAALGPRETTFVQAILVKKWSPNTARLCMSVLRGVLKQAHRMGHTSADVYLRAIGTSKIRGERDQTGRMVGETDQSRLFSYIAELPDPYRVMVKAVFAVALYGGLRRHELAGVRVDQFEPQRGLTVLGKGNKERFVPLATPVRKAVLEWLSAREKLKLRSSTLFVVFPPTGAVEDRPMSPHCTWRLLKRVSGEAGLDLRPHDLRRTCATTLLETHPMSVVQKILGHDSPETTARYDMSGAKEAAEAIETSFGKVSLEGEAHFERDGEPFEVKAHLKALRKKGLSVEQIAKGLRAMGVTRAGRPVEARDL